MGSSGSGKTTLLNLISRRLFIENLDISANGNPYNFEEFGLFGNYVTQ
jgi:ABC-type lipoprotein export system ATPase subunit